MKIVSKPSAPPFIVRPTLQSHTSIDSLHDLRQQTQHYAMDRDEHVSKANKALADTMIPNRVSRANLTAAQRQVEELQIGLAKLRKDNERSTSACFLRATHLLNSSQSEIACGLCAKRSRRAGALCQRQSSRYRASSLRRPPARPRTSRTYQWLSHAHGRASFRSWWRCSTSWKWAAARPSVARREQMASGR